MLTGELRNKVDAIWTTLWTEGSTNPLTNIEQITYLLFMKGLDQLQLQKEEDANLLGLDFETIFPKDKPNYRWHVFKNLGSAAEMFELMQGEIFPFIKNLQGEDGDTSFSRYMKEANFQINKPQTLQKVVTAIDQLPTEDNDIKGDIYEYLLSKLQTSGTNGQFRTPRHIIKMMVELVEPNAEDVICDPACGTSGFLVAASEYLRDNDKDFMYDQAKSHHFHNDMFYGYDMDNTMLRISAMNMMLHNVDNPQIKYQDSLSEDNRDRAKYSLILANPPFKGSLDYESVANDLLANIKTKKTELLFVELILNMLRSGGRAAVIVPDGVLFGSSKAHKDLRKELVENNDLKGVISMPSGVFKPYAGVSTAVLIFVKTNKVGNTKKVWFYDMEADGYSLNDNRTPIEDNDIPDIIEAFKNLSDQEDKPRTGKSFMVDKEEIAENDYDLSINKYKEIEYEEVEYDPPQVIIERIESMEREIQDGLEDLKKILGDMWWKV